MKRHTPTIAAISVVAFFATGARAECKLAVERLASGLSRPVALVSPGDGSPRLFIAEQHTGRILILDRTTNAVLPQPFLDIDGLSTGSEQGLLGLAFHPDYPANGLFFVNVTVGDRSTEIRRYRVSAADPNVADPDSMVVVLSYAQPFSNHNGGWIEFGPDGYLYIASGDGGSGFDPGNRAQNLAALLGKILRIDADGADGSSDLYGIPPGNPFVDVPGARPEIWAYGLRNPWRCGFDRETGDLYIGDVGQGEIEEIDFQAAASSGGENYGWRVMEGSLCSDDSQTGGNPPCDDSSLVPPIHEYVHPTGFAVVGGYVYRGKAIDWLQGAYFFADYSTTKIWSFRYDGTDITEFTDRTAELEPSNREESIGLISSFGQDAEGELYILDMSDGEIYRIIAAQSPVAGDVNRDCRVDFADLALLAQNWLAGGQ